MNLTPLKQLRTEEGRREYYTYDPSNPVTMVHHVEPYLDPRFNIELADLFGYDIHGDQRLRIVWAGSLRAPAFKDMGDGTTIEYEGMKYPYMRLRKVIGYEYMDDDNKRVLVTSLDLVPQGKAVTEKIEYDDLGIMKFALEMKYTAEELVKIGRYPVPGSAEEKSWCFNTSANTKTPRVSTQRSTGAKYRHAPNPKGEYLFCHYIETADGQFADVTDAVIDSVRAIFNRALTETEEEYIARKLEARRQLAILTQDAEDLRYANAAEDARIRAEKKLAKGKIIYGK